MSRPIVSVVAVGVVGLIACTGMGEHPPEGRGTTVEREVMDKLPDGPPFHPDTYWDEGVTVMPIVFPDGSSAELVYPPRLRLERLNVAPDAYHRLKGPGLGRGCGLDLVISRSNGLDEIVADEPVVVYKGPTDGAVGLWPPTKIWEPYHWLVSTFGEWNVFVPCTQAFSDESPRPDEVRENQSIWARSLQGHQTSSGWLVLDPVPPLRFLDERTIRLSSRHLVIDIHLGRYKPLDDQHVGADGLAQWVEAGGRIRVYALAFSDFRKEFIREVAASLRVRGVRATPLA